MSPKKKKPGVTLPKGCEVVSVSEVEAGINSHVYKLGGFSNSGVNPTEKDKVNFQSLISKMTVSSEGSGNHTNTGEALKLMNTFTCMALLSSIIISISFTQYQNTSFPLQLKLCFLFV